MSQWVTETERESEAVSVLMAGPPQRVTTWYQSLMSDRRFRVVSFANDNEDLQRKLANRPEVVLIDATIFAGPQLLIELLTGVEGASFIVLPANAEEDVIGEIESVPSVKGVYRGDANLAQLANRMYETAYKLRAEAPSLVEPWITDRRQGGVMSGLRLISVWNQAGGVGKTTVASNLAYEAARRGIRSLLIGLNAPDDLPLILGLDPEPNISAWQANPTPEGLKTLTQQVGDLDVIAGFRSVFDESRAMNIKPEEGESIPNLAMTAAYYGYASVVMDTPPSTTAPAAIKGANTLLLVSRPTASGAQRTVEAYRTVAQRMSGEHRIPPANILLVLNMANSSDYGANEWHRMIATALRKAGLGAPPIAVVLPEDPSIRVAQNNGKVAMLASDGLARGIHRLADALYGIDPAAKEDGKGRGFKIGGIRFRVKG